MLQFVNIHADTETLPLKIVIRRLPPDFTLDIFKNQVRPIPPHNYLNFVKADGGEVYSFSRAYINFLNYKDLLDFKEKFDNYVFIGQNGVEYPAVIEFAPFQNIPRKYSKKKDVKCGTIQNDSYFINFRESVERKNKVIERSEFDFQLKTENKNITLTPLLKYISEKRNERRTLENKHNSSKTKATENCIVFVNSTMKKNHKFGMRSRKSKFINNYNF